MGSMPRTGHRVAQSFCIKIAWAVAKIKFLERMIYVGYMYESRGKALLLDLVGCRRVGPRTPRRLSFPSNDCQASVKLDVAHSNEVLSCENIL